MSLKKALMKAAYAMGLVSTMLFAQPATINGSYTEVGFVTAGDIFAQGINPQGDIVGYYTVSGETGFLIHNGVKTDISVPGTTNTRANGINQLGDIVVSSTLGGFLLHDGVYSRVMVDGLPAAAANGINAQGDIVGVYSGGGFVLRRNGDFRNINYPGARFTEPRSINSGGDVVGLYFAPGTSFSYGFLFHDGAYSTIDAPFALGGTSAWGINNCGDIVGSLSIGNGAASFLLRDGVFIGVGDPDPKVRSTVALGINARGDIVGAIQLIARVWRGFLFEPHRVD